MKRILLLLAMLLFSLLSAPDWLAVGNSAEAKAGTTGQSQNITYEQIDETKTIALTPKNATFDIFKGAINPDNNLTTVNYTVTKLEANPSTLSFSTNLFYQMKDGSLTINRYATESATVQPSDLTVTEGNHYDWAFYWKAAPSFPDGVDFPHRLALLLEREIPSTNFTVLLDVHYSLSGTTELPPRNSSEDQDTSDSADSPAYFPAALLALSFLGIIVITRR